MTTQLAIIQPRLPKMQHDGRWLRALPTHAFEALSPYRLAALLGKNVIHPGGRFSTRKVLKAAGFAAHHEVLEVGCGVGTTAVKIARTVKRLVAIDIDPAMLERATARATRSGLSSDRLDIRHGDVTHLDFPDHRFDRVIVESVHMFVDRPLALAEVFRVLRPGGRIVDHEFGWSKTPTPRTAARFEDLFPGSFVATPDAWQSLYKSAGFTGVSVQTGLVLNFTPPGMLIDEGPHFPLMVLRILSRWRRIKTMARFMVQFNRLIPSIRYHIIAADKPS